VAGAAPGGQEADVAPLLGLAAGPARLLVVEESVLPAVVTSEVCAV
jgi:hypothetical protein